MTACAWPSVISIWWQPTSCQDVPSWHAGLMLLELACLVAQQEALPGCRASQQLVALLMPRSSSNLAGGMLADLLRHHIEDAKLLSYTDLLGGWLLLYVG